MALRTVTHLFVASIATFALCGIAPAAERGENEIEILYPSPLGSQMQRPEQVVIAVPPATIIPATPADVKVSVQVIVQQPSYWAYRQAQIRRALFQNYTGFVGQYSGPRYPF